MSIRLRLTLWYTVILAIAFSLFGSAIYWFVDYSIYGDKKASIEKQAARLTINYNFDFWNGIELKVGGDFQFQNEEMYVQIVNYSNNQVKKTNNLMEIDGEFPYSTSEIPKDGFKNVLVKKQAPFLVFEQVIYLKDQPIGLVQVGTYVGQEQKFFAELRNILFVLSFFGLLLAFFCGLFLSSRFLRPIEQVIKATGQVQKGSDLSMRIASVNPNDEIGQLVDNLNGMLERTENFYQELEEAYRVQRRFVADASHELRTPLTSIRGNIDLLHQIAEEISQTLDEDRKKMCLEAIQDISDEAKRMSRLVNDLLNLARSDKGIEFEQKPLDMYEVMNEVIRRIEYIPRTATFEVEKIADIQEIKVLGDKEYLQQAVYIFMENAFKYTENGSVILGFRKEESQFGIVITDTGIGMNADQVPKIFDRFYRADESRGVTDGVGLGLSIAKWIVDEHQGSIEVFSKPGEGTKFVLWLPLYFESNKII